MIYTVERIDEDMDFGCEERAPGSPVMAVVTLQGDDGKERIIRYPDRELYERDVNEGDRIRFESDGQIHKDSE